MLNAARAHGRPMIVTAMMTAARSHAAAIHTPPVTIQRMLRKSLSRGIRKFEVRRSLWPLELLDRGFQEPRRFATGHRTMVEGQRERQQAVRDELAIGGDGARSDAAGAEDRDLRRDDHERRETPGEHA